MRQAALLAAFLLAAIPSLVAPAYAKCTRLAFSVNDYGKEGPIKDAKELLDKHIAQKMAERGVTQYTVGKKDVSCELFLDLLVFDEHTCKAEATVCWGGDKATPATAATDATAPAGKAANKEAKASAPPAKAAKAPVKEAEAAAAPAAEQASPVTTIEPEPSAGSETETAAEPAAGDATTKSAESEPAATETGAIEKYAAPKRIVIPDPIQVKRGMPVEPGTEEAPPEDAATP